MSITTLKIYDFDNTLFRSPCDTPANRRLYEKHTGLPWIISKENAAYSSKKLKRRINPRRGWWGRGETLSEPLVPFPTPEKLWIKSTLESLLNSLQDDNVLNVLMSGRHNGIKQEVLRILHQGGKFPEFITVNKKGCYEWVYNDKFHFHLLGDNGPYPELSPKPQETLPWKIWLIKQYIHLYTDIKKIEIYEDRDSHVEAFNNLGNQFSQDVVVYHVKE